MTCFTCSVGFRRKSRRVGMSNVNHYAISKILGSTMRPVSGSRFGGFRVLGTSAAAIKAVQHAQYDARPVKFTLDDDRLVARAFEEVRDGASTDALLWDTNLARRFLTRCAEWELDFPPATLVRRLIHIRKSPKVYGRHGILLSATARSEPHPSIVPQYAHVIEFALVRLRYRYGASIDTILADPALREQFENLARDVAPELTGEELGLGALYIRKTRYFSKRDAQLAQALDTSVVEGAMTPPVSLAEAVTNDVPSGPGLLELREGDRYLYVARNESLQPAVEQLKTGRPFRVLADGFWQPALEEITLRYVEGRTIASVGIARWELRLIQTREPVFNWPMTNTKEAA
jgi:hypothetical protein